jgi:hypothetical protein
MNERECVMERHELHLRGVAEVDKHVIKGCKLLENREQGS